MVKAHIMKYQVYGLQENYIDVGKHFIKVVISPRFKTGQDFKIDIVDSDRNKMSYDVSYWGRKLNIEFEIKKDTPDGLATATVSRSGEKVGLFNFWIIK